ncbi:MAG: diguanylate cyclase [bacterium]|nr:diguanylate cyclase [bacterium]
MAHRRPWRPALWLLNREMLAVGNTQRILVADDKPAEVDSLVDSLTQAGYEVLQADSGASAAQLAATCHPDLIVLAAALQHGAGGQLDQAAGIPNANTPSPIIFTTGYADSEAATQAFPAQGHEYVAKPIRSEEILSRISTHLRLRDTEQILAQRQRELRAQTQQLNDSKSEVARLHRCDPITGLLNWTAWRENLLTEHMRSKRYDRIYSILMVDLDHFKPFNETHGHIAGDSYLALVAQHLVRTCRSTDVVGRYGGGEFVILAPETDLDAGHTLGERIAQDIRDLPISHPVGSAAEHLTVSIGVAGREFGSWEDGFKRASQALAMAKQAGRDRVYVDHYTALADEHHADLSTSWHAPAARSAESRRRPPSVLLVSEHSADSASYASELEMAGYRVGTAEDGRSTLTSARESLPDVVVVDTALPDMDGLRCARQLKADPLTRDIPVILVGTDPSGNGIQQSIGSGADEWLAKPIATAELCLRVQSMVRLRQKQTELLRSYETRGEQARVLGVLLDYCQELAIAPDLHHVLTTTVTITADVCASRRICIMLPDAEHRVLNVALARGMSDEAARSVQVPFGDSISGCVYQSGRPVVANSEDDLCFEGQQHDTAFFGPAPLISAPLGASNQVVGVLNIANRLGQRPFRTQELRYVDLIANIAGSAIQGLLSRDSRDQARDSIVVALARLAEHRDNDTGKHIDRVTQYCLILAQELRKDGAFSQIIDGDFLYNLERAAPLHDIGKVAVPDHILLKPGRLTSEEMDIMRPHTIIGAETIRSVTQRAPGVGFLEMAEEIAYCHHEWWNGSGYPRGLAGEQIPVGARIAALADVYDALTTKRCYKEAFPHSRAVAIIVGSSGTQFDPRIVDAFLRHEPAFIDLAAALADTPDADPGMDLPPIEPALSGCAGSPRPTP